MNKKELQNLPALEGFTFSLDSVPEAAASAKVAPSVQQIASPTPAPVPTPSPTPSPTPPPAANTGGTGGIGSAGGTGSSAGNAMNDYSSMMAGLLNQIDLKAGANQAADVQNRLKGEQEDFARWGLGESNRQADQAFAQADTSKGMADTNIADAVARAEAMLGSQQSAFDANASNRQAQLASGIADREAMNQNSLSSRNNAIDALAAAMGRSPDGMFQQNLKSIGAADANIRSLIGEREGSALTNSMNQSLLEGQQAIDYRGEDTDYQILALQRKADDEYQQMKQTAQAMANAGLINYDSAMAQIEDNYAQSMQQIEQMKIQADQAKAQMAISALETLFNMSQIES